MILSTESTSNLPLDVCKQLGVEVIPMQIILNDATFLDFDKQLPLETFYQSMRDGATPTTAQINDFRAREYFEKLLARGQDVLHIGFSTGLSESTNTLKRVASELNATHKNKVVVVDSLNAASGEGMLVLYASDYIKQGKSIEEIASLLENLRPKINSIFTVEALKYLVRGGRLSKVSGMLGTLLKIKPILRVDENGKLVAFKKVISRRKSIGELINICKQNIAEKKYVYVNHAACKEDAELLAAELKKALGVTPVVTDISQVIGCHTGPGLLAVFFVSK